MRLIHADARDALAEMADNSVDAMVTDPPAGISFMGRDWDHDHGGRDGWCKAFASIFAECLRAMKPGAHGLVWALPRTSHWTATALEDAGFEVRDRVSHLFGTGFPKSLDVSKAIDKVAGARREFVGVSPHFSKLGKSCTPFPGNQSNDGQTKDRWRDERQNVIRREKRAEYSSITAPATDAAKEWEGWGTALKPACEDWWLVRKPLSEKTVAANVQKWGTGALNIDGTRIGNPTGESAGGGWGWPQDTEPGASGTMNKGWNGRPSAQHPSGRWPANLVFSHHPDCRQVGTKRVRGGDYARDTSGGRAIWGEGKEAGHGGGYVDADGKETVEAWDCHPDCPVKILDEQSGELHTQRPTNPSVMKTSHFGGGRPSTRQNHFADTRAGASRFFYCAKPSRRERGEGNNHPTVKAVKLMRYLCRLVTPPGGIVLDPFCGTGSTGIAALQEGFDFVGIEREAEYIELAENRIVAANQERQPELFG